MPMVLGIGDPAIAAITQRPMQTRDIAAGMKPLKLPITIIRDASRCLVVLGASLLSITSALTEAQAQTRVSVNSPASGVICDQQGSICYDRQGPSVSLTRFYFGEIYGKRLENMMRGKPSSNYILLSSGTLCDLRARSCWSDGWRKTRLDNALSQRLFAPTAAPSTTSVMGFKGLQTPRLGVVCDPVTRTCYDQNGISLGGTRDYFGAYAEQNVRRNQEGRVTQQEFRMSNGIYCDVRSRTCWSDSWDHRQVNTDITDYLFNQGAISSSVWGDDSASTREIRQAQCVITRWFQTLFRGTCVLREQTNNLGRLLKVNLQDGSNYSIRRPNTGNYELIDPQGKIWPLEVREQGRTVSFNWSDRVLTVSDTSASNSGINLMQLIDSLLGR